MQRKMHLLQEEKRLCTSIIKKDGIQIQPRVDEGTKKCRKCERFKQTGVQNHKGHDPTCSKNRKHGKLTSKETIRVNKQANIYLKSNQQKLKPAEKGGSNPLAATDVQAFLEPDYCQTVNNASSTPPPSPSSKPSSTSQKWFNNRGVESKLEKAHHALAHFGNGGMGNDLCDTLNLEGTATYNCNIRFRRLLSLMTAEERKAISPATYQEYHPHTDHCRLAFLNRLGREVGLFIDVHFDVEILPPDNGERFFSEYLKQQLLRMKTFPPDPVTGRCMCNRCGGRKHINNKYSNTTSINRIVVRNEEKQAEQQRNDNTTAVARLSTATTATTTTTTITSDTDTDTASMPIATSTSTTIAASSTSVAAAVSLPLTLLPATAAASITSALMMPVASLPTTPTASVTNSIPLTWPLWPPLSMMKQAPSYSLPSQHYVASSMPSNIINNCNCCCPKSLFQYQNGFCCSVFQNYTYSTNKKQGRPPHCRICNQKKNQNTRYI